LGVASARAQQQPERDFSHIQVKTLKITDSLYMLSGAGGNVGVSVGDDGVIIVDTDFKQMSAKIDAALKKLSNKPVRFVIDTHWHLDHAGGNAYFQNLGAIVVAQENVRKVMSAGTVRNGVSYPAYPIGDLPSITYGDYATLHFNGEEIRLTFAPHAHSGDDTVVYFVQAKVLHLGDLYRTDGFPIGDLDDGGSVKGVIAILDSLIASYPADTKVIPGHGALMTVADMKPFVEMLRDTRARVAKGVQQNKTLEQLKNEKVLAGYEKYAGQVTMERFTEELYRELTWPGSAQPQ
jgi:glyoxylase-like metal-dependent hydrolase (beta-lactamase superfamily II)